MDFTPMTRISDSQIELLDANGRLIGTITRPVDSEALGPGREKVYLARRSDRRPQAA
jgi:hypothetical protein